MPNNDLLDKNFLFYKTLNNSINFTHLPSAGNTTNLGDDIQVECAARLWGTRRYIERDDFSQWQPDMIVPFFGWYGYDLQNPPPKSVCILVSFHLCDQMKKHVSNSTKFKDWFKFCVRQQGFPAMARDISTMDFLRKLGIDSAFGGCVTQTLDPYTGDRNGTISIDVPDHVAKTCGARYTQLNINLKKMTHEERLMFAQDRISLYSRTKHVHTSRLHAYLPCRALGTPVTFYNYKIFEPSRLSGLI